MEPARRYNAGMIEATLPLSPELWTTVPAPVQGPLMEQWVMLRLKNAALRAQNVALHERVRDLEARLGQNSPHSFQPPSLDPPQVPVKCRALP